MIVEDLINKLKNYPLNAEVVIFDWRKHLSDDSEEISSLGIYEDFDLDMMDDSESIPFLALLFDNDDYQEVVEEK